MSVTWARAGLALMSLVFAASAHAGAIQVSPVRITLSAQAPTAVVQVANQGSESQVVQIAAMAWTQESGRDAYSPTREILATPPIFTIPAGGTQIVRVGLRRPPDPDRELAYRLYIEEVPSAGAPGRPGAVRVLLRIGVPVFVAPAAAGEVRLEWRIVAVSSTELRVEAANRGPVHVQVSGFALAAAGKPLAEHRGAVYVLPGQVRQWNVAVAHAPVAGNSLKLVAHTDAGERSAELVVEP